MQRSARQCLSFRLPHCCFDLTVSFALDAVAFSFAFGHSLHSDYRTPAGKNCLLTHKNTH